MDTIGLVACSKAKRDHAVPARELYTSPLFRKASAYCERVYGEWYILSAKYGLVHPDTVIEPYDLTLGEATKFERREWAGWVRTQLGERGFEYRHFAIHAGANYARHLLPLLHADWPVKGLGIGQQLAWYTSREGRDRNER